MQGEMRWDEVLFRGRRGARRHIPEEDHDKGDDVEASVKAERSLWAHHLQHAWEGQGEDESPAQTGGDGPGHADFAVGEREDLNSKLGLLRQVADKGQLTSALYVKGTGPSPGE